jgi:hypothetical protein
VAAVGWIYHPRVVMGKRQVPGHKSFPGSIIVEYNS